MGKELFKNAVICAQRYSYAAVIVKNKDESGVYHYSGAHYYRGGNDRSGLEREIIGLLEEGKDGLCSGVLVRYNETKGLYGQAEILFISTAENARSLNQLLHNKLHSKAKQYDLEDPKFIEEKDLCQVVNRIKEKDSLWNMAHFERSGGEDAFFSKCKKGLEVGGGFCTALEAGRSAAEAAVGGGSVSR